MLLPGIWTSIVSTMGTLMWNNKITKNSAVMYPLIWGFYFQEPIVQIKLHKCSKIQNIHWSNVNDDERSIWPILGGVAERIMEKHILSINNTKILQTQKMGQNLQDTLKHKISVSSMVSFWCKGKRTQPVFGMTHGK